MRFSKHRKAKWKSENLNSSSTSVTLDVIRVSADPAQFAQISFENGNRFNGHVVKHLDSLNIILYTYKKAHLIGIFKTTLDYAWASVLVRCNCSIDKQAHLIIRLSFGSVSDSEKQILRRQCCLLLHAIWLPCMRFEVCDSNWRFGYWQGCIWICCYQQVWAWPIWPS